MITLAGILFVLNISDHFESMAYLWPLLIAAGSAGAAYSWRFEPDRPVHRRSRRLLRTMSWLTLGLAFFFEVLIFEGLPVWWPVVVIAYGAWLLWRDRTIGRPAKA